MIIWGVELSDSKRAIYLQSGSSEKQKYFNILKSALENRHIYIP